jgi:polar amino acid transport system substrate-binding protein
MKSTVMIGAAMLVACGAWAAEVRMAFGDRIPPFCFPETHSGIELEVIGEALAYRGHTLKPLFYPLARVPLALKAGKVDAAMTDAGEDMSTSGVFYGDSAVVYDNVFYTLSQRNLTIRKPSDLKGLTVIAFQGAVKRYPQWLGPVADAGNLVEQNNQAIQVRTLDIGRYDVVLSDRTIFRYFSLQMQRESGVPPKPVAEHEFTTPKSDDYRPVFRERTIRDDFNAGLKHLRATGRFRQIYDKYTKG